VTAHPDQPDLLDFRYTYTEQLENLLIATVDDDNDDDDDDDDDGDSDDVYEIVHEKDSAQVSQKPIEADSDNARH
jgi:hypothetical protein